MKRSGTPALDRDKSPLIDADHDVVRIADALRASPHIRSVTAAEPGDETIWFTDDHGTGFALTLTGEEPCADDPQTVASASGRKRIARWVTTHHTDQPSMSSNVDMAPHPR